MSWEAPANTGPPITGYGVRYKPSSESAWTAHAHSGTETATTIEDLTPGTGYDVQVNAVNDEGTSDWSPSGTGTTTAAAPANSAPSFDAGASTTLTVAENSGAVGTVAASDADGDALEYSLSGADAGSFSISSDGAITPAAGTILDYETKTSYSLTAEVKDNKDSDGEAAPSEPADDTIAVTVSGDRRR